MIVKPAKFEAEDFRILLRLHLDEAFQGGCSAALGEEALKADDIQMFEARDIGGALLGFAALKTLDANIGEIKSVRTHPDHLRKGVSRALMANIEQIARESGLHALCLETHPTPAYAPAVKLYEKLGYHPCGAFGDYREDPNSIFMKKIIN